MTTFWLALTGIVFAVQPYYEPLIISLIATVARIVSLNDGLETKKVIRLWVLSFFCAYLAYHFLLWKEFDHDLMLVFIGLSSFFSFDLADGASVLLKKTVKKYDDITEIFKKNRD